MAERGENILRFASDATPECKQRHPPGDDASGTEAATLGRGAVPTGLGAGDAVARGLLTAC